jgi:transcription initiation factor TFIIIB Brf1 subunit/transcription initiation factor TFIIB
LVILNDLEKNMTHSDKTQFGRTKPEDFIERYCSKLNVNKELTCLCMFLSMKIEKENAMPENTPHSIAASIVFFVAHICQLGITKKDVKAVSEISEVTINKCFKKLEKMKLQIVPSQILLKYGVYERDREKEQHQKQKQKYVSKKRKLS